ncbi:unnamed protein product [Cuscuta campestris]|uniref:Ubiquitin-like protease family profile domain-containing protein n=1 Tax=Cuscuta campestris TaxID=132261 RepID=A0A484M506_9ASTE|nr:unnamed protein product [Cuscuta campestris]
MEVEGGKKNHGKKRKQAEFAVEEHTAEPCTPAAPSTSIVLRKSPPSVLPVKLSKWLVQNFDPDSCSLNILNERVRITEKDVHLTLGLPTGPFDVLEAQNKPTDPEDYKTLVLKWRDEWGLQRDFPHTNAMPDRILGMAGSSEGFKLNFMVFFISTCISGNTNTFANSRVLRSLVNLSNVNKLNWCKYTLTSLINSTIQWKRKSNPYFTGPVLFLIMFYVDRVVFRMRVVPRTFPTMLGWTSQKLKEREGLERESGGFGREFARALCSPFWIRNMEALSRLSRAEKVLTDYVFNKSLLLGEVLYKDMFCEMKRSDLISFSEGSVSSLILQIWCRFLNAEEKHRSKSDVYRVFLSTNPFAEFVKISLYDDAHETFCEVADRELVEQQFYGGIDMCTTDLVFFLVADETDKDDVYIVCFNMKKEKITIIDSIEDKTKVYDTCVECLKKGMCEFFNEKQLEQKESKISKFPFEITKKACYGNMEGMGVGVIAMRQLETFKGNLNTWKMDLNKNDVNGL